MITHPGSVFCVLLVLTVIAPNLSGKTYCFHAVMACNPNLMLFVLIAGCVESLFGSEKILIVCFLFCYILWFVRFQQIICMRKSHNSLPFSLSYEVIWGHSHSHEKIWWKMAPKFCINIVGFCLFDFKSSFPFSSFLLLFYFSLEHQGLYY